MDRTTKILLILSILPILIIFIALAGSYRVYYGAGVGTRVVEKDSFSFKDTIVNLDDLLGQPRIVVATGHPAVKRQLEQMGIIETDRQVQNRVRREISEEAMRIQNQMIEDAKRIRNEAGF
jgi:hypothetical protein